MHVSAGTAGWKGMYMNSCITGAAIRQLRIRNHLTQLQLASKLHLSDKTISKWETGKGSPDITLLEPLAKALGVSVAELLSGSPVRNANVSSNMLRSKFYVCPVCGNVIHSMGEIMASCHGIRLTPAVPALSDEDHKIFIERSEDEYYVRIDHDMTKQHYISFMAALSDDRLQMVRLYPEGNAEARFKLRGVRRICFFCSRDGLFFVDPVRGIDDRESGYDVTKEREELERAADALFG